MEKKKKDKTFKTKVVDGKTYISMPRSDYDRLRKMMKDYEGVDDISKYASTIEESGDPLGDIDANEIWVDASYFNDYEKDLFTETNPAYNIVQKYESVYRGLEEYQPKIEIQEDSGVLPVQTNDYRWSNKQLNDYINKNINLSWIKRIGSEGLNYEPIQNTDGTTSDLDLIYFEEDGKYYVTPTIWTDENNKLVRLSKEEAIEKSRINNERMEFPSEGQAWNFVTKYKDSDLWKQRVGEDYKIGKGEYIFEDPKGVNIKGVGNIKLEDNKTSLMKESDAVSARDKEINRMFTELKSDFPPTFTTSSTSAPTASTTLTTPVSNTSDVTTTDSASTVATTLTTSNANEEVNENIKVLREIFQRDKELAEKAKRWGGYKSILDTAINTNSLIQNMLGGRPDVVEPTLSSMQTIPSSRVMEQQELDRMVSSGLAAGRQVLRETGKTELVPGMMANAMETRATESTQIANRELQRQAQEAQLQAGIESQNAQMINQINLYNDQKLTQAALGLSEANAKLLSNYSTILGDTIKNKVAIENQNNAAEVALKMLEMGIEAEEISKYFSLFQNVVNSPSNYNILQPELTKETKENINY